MELNISVRILEVVKLRDTGYGQQRYTTHYRIATDLIAVSLCSRLHLYCYSPDNVGFRLNLHHFTCFGEGFG